MKSEAPIKNLKHTLQSLKVQVQDSLPYISQYIPKSIKTPEELFYFLKGITVYKSDPKNVELLQTVQTLMDRNGKGDCDCFTILTLASCIYLNFSPQQVVLVGKKKSAPSHIYSMVFDKSKNKMCSMDLTNPYYCTERSYKYKQTLNFMMTLRLEDNFFASKASRAAKKNARSQKKVVRQNRKLAVRTAKEKKKIVRAEGKSNRITSRQEGRTARGDERRLAKLTKEEVKTARQDNKMIRVKGRRSIINARAEKRLDMINQKESAAEHEFTPESDQGYDYNEEENPGSTYQASEADQDEFDEFQLMPEEEEEEEEEEEGLSFFPGAGLLVKKASGLVKKVVDSTGTVKGAVKKGASKYNEIVILKQDNARLKLDLKREAKSKYFFAAGGTVLGAIAGILIKSHTK